MDVVVVLVGASVITFLFVLAITVVCCIGASFAIAIEGSVDEDAVGDADECVD
jgi:hypothetical protein